MLVARGNAFQQDSVLQGHVLIQHIAHAKRRIQPVLHTVLLQNLFVLDEVLVSAFALAFYDDPEHVEDGISVAVEGGA